jgi:uridine phosphorylase
LPLFLILDSFGHTSLKMIGKSELILNNDGSIFHLHLKPGNLATDIILVGDPGRVDVIAGFFNHIEFTCQNREFKTVTGQYKNKRISVISTGIGTDNIDIVLNELDALVNIDLERREPKKEKTQLNIVRIGTSGGLQGNLPVNAFVVSEKSIGFDGLLNFYANRYHFCDTEFEKVFKDYVEWGIDLPSPYVVDASETLLSKFEHVEFTKGVTISAPGFYAPQGRELRLPLAYPKLNRKIETFGYKGLKITNFEMESSAIYGLSKLLGHNALTVCLIIANRVTLQANESYHDKMKTLIRHVLNSLCQN